MTTEPGLEGRGWWPRTLGTRLLLLLLLAVALAQGAALLIYRVERSHAVRDVMRVECLGRSISAYRLAEKTGETRRDEVLRTVETPLTRYWITPEGPTPPAQWISEARHHLERPLSERLRTDLPRLHLEQTPHTVWQEPEPSPWRQEHRIHTIPLPEWNGFGFAMQLPDGQWLNTVHARPLATAQPTLTTGYYLALLLTVGIFVLLAWFVGRRLSRPLRELTNAAERLGRGEAIAPIPPEGPEDIRATIDAFNRMQTRLHRFMEDRTRMLAAIGHDLRTPITSLRLRAEFVDDADVREKIIATLDEMQAMTEAALAFARSEAIAEPTRKVDLNALVGSLADDLADLGWPVKWSDHQRTPCSCRPEALRRAVRNVIENAVRYGKEARVSLRSGPEGVAVTVADSGPGIPEGEYERVFSPFVRGEASRNTATGGVGLGLAIARSIIRAHGGEITLQREAGAFSVRLHLPAEPQE